MDEARAALLDFANSDPDPELKAAVMATVAALEQQWTILRLTAHAANGSEAHISLNYYLK